MTKIIECQILNSYGLSSWISSKYRSFIFKYDKREAGLDIEARQKRDFAFG